MREIGGCPGSRPRGVVSWNREISGCPGSFAVLFQATAALANKRPTIHGRALGAYVDEPPAKDSLTISRDKWVSWFSTSRFVPGLSPPVLP